MSEVVLEKVTKVYPGNVKAVEEFQAPPHDLSNVPHLS